MPSYLFWYSDTSTYKAGFEATSLEEAQKLLDGVFAGESAIEDLPAYWSKEKGYESEYDISTLEEIED